MAHAKRDWRTSWPPLIVNAALFAFGGGCIQGSLQKPKLLKHPAAPMVLMDPVQARVAVEAADGQLEEYGVVELEPGQTVGWYDWAPPLPEGE